MLDAILSTNRSLSGRIFVTEVQGVLQPTTGCALTRLFDAKAILRALNNDKTLKPIIAFFDSGLSQVKIVK